LHYLTILTRIFCNTSGFGKTRVLLEGLCAHWGFYLVASRAADEIGSIDLQSTLETVRWTTLPALSHIALSASQDQLCEQRIQAGSQNSEAVESVLWKVFYMRFCVFYRFIKIAKDSRYPFDDALKYMWLLFQLDPPEIEGEDTFRWAMTYLTLTTDEDLINGIQTLRPKRTLQLFHPNGGPQKVFFVLDEAQSASETSTRRGVIFCDKTGREDRPLLRPILRFFEMSQFNSIQFILSGTGFSWQVFQRVADSGVAKNVAKTWKFYHGSGGFYDQTTQSAYIRQYIPDSFLETPSGKRLLERSYWWLRGR
jgi:hypothetical protein